MSFLKKHIEQSLVILEKYQGKIPFHLYLKDVFKQNKNWGSKDRKNYRSICYKYFRNYFILKDLSKEKVIENLFEQLSFENEKTSNTNAFNHFEGHISEHISIEKLNHDFSIEPNIYFRSLIEFEKHIENDFKNLGISFKKNDTIQGIFELSAKTNLENYINQGKGYVQDLSCQLAIEELSLHHHFKRVWDCCSGAGGKAIDIMIKEPKCQLFCSDKRKQILQNLKIRFQMLGLTLPNIQEIDLLNDIPLLNDGFYNQKLIIADVPCTGSGTWRRNPENIVYFDNSNIHKYANIQLSILENLDPFIGQQGEIFYMTCSVFKAENEDNIKRFLNRYNYEIVFEKYFGGYSMNADFIYGCLLRKTI